MNNLYNHAGYEDVKNELRQELARLQKQYDDPIEEQLQSQSMMKKE